MRRHRVAALVTTGLLVLSPLLGAVPAARAAGGATTVTLTPLADEASTLDYGDTVSLSGTLKAEDGSFVDAGSVRLYVTTPAARKRTLVATDDSPHSSFYFADVTPAMNSTYTVVYSGGTSDSGTWTGDTSAPVTVSVARSLELRAPHGLTIAGRVVPDYARGRIKVLQTLDKSGTRTEVYARVTTNRRGAFSFKAPDQVGFSFVLVVPGDDEFAATRAPYHVV